MTSDPQPPAEPAPKPPPPAPTIHEAELVPGPSGAVEWGNEMDFQGAVARRAEGLDIVVRGAEEDENRRLAGRIEAAIGKATPPRPPHTSRAGPQALPHFQQVSPPPVGHSFYELANRKARKKR